MSSFRNMIIKSGKALLQCSVTANIQNLLFGIYFIKGNYNIGALGKYGGGASFI